VTDVDLRRLAIAFACSIAIHEVLAALLPAAPPDRQDREIVTHVAIAREERRPTPRPTATPTPQPVKIVVRHVQPSGTHAHIEMVKHAGARRPTPPKSLLATPVPMVLPTGGAGAGAQNGAGAGSLSNAQGNGSGTGDAGNGSGAGLCGAVDFQASGSAVLDASTGMYERTNIVATVYYTDGSSERVPLDWTWRWPNEAQDPFDTDSDAPMLFQFPPLAQRANEPPVIQYIMAHTTPSGHTRLNGQCPNIPPAPASRAAPESTPQAVPD
jgi:hypothetical protein